MPPSAQGTRKTLVADARRAVRDCTGAALRRAARRISRYMDRALQASGLSFAQFGLMTAVAAASDDTIAALAERLDLDPSTLSRNLRALERAGLLEIAVVERDLRRRAVWLTEQGARRLESAMPLWRRAQAALDEQLAPASLRRLDTACATLAE